MSNLTTAIQLNRLSTYKLNNGLEVPISGLSLHGLDRTKISVAVESALLHGLRHIDAGEHEIQLAAEAVATYVAKCDLNRDDVWFAARIPSTKLGYEATVAQLQRIAASTKASLGHVDAVILEASSDASAKLIQDSWRALQENYSDTAKAEVQVKAIGVANFTIDALQELLRWEGLLITPAVNQVELNPWKPCLKLREFCFEHNVLLETTAPLAGLDDPELLDLEKRYKISKTDILLKWAFLQGVIVLIASANDSLIGDVAALLPKVEVEDDQLEELKTYGKIDLDVEILNALSKPDSA
jgi:diketogulonate reductase-like aldo/keto reductase